MESSDIPALLWSIAGIIMAVALLGFVGFAGRVLWRLGGAARELENAIKNVTDETLPLIGGVTETVGHTNHQLQKVDTITTKVGVISDNGVQVATNVSALTALFAATLGSPVIKVAAFTYGVRQAMGGGRKPGATRGRRSKR